MVFASVILGNPGNVPVFYSSHQDSPELSHSILLPGHAVGVITRHLVARPEGGDGMLDIEISGLATVGT